eukprot:TRINITY_DN12937_c0_g1_i2.p1 TRINITY_DN12937_c0_g1~~TRINITY_DN12937_c0_g1_i2.p1  ORF type:complete len:193 (-),score=18.25 TRINITY_DN12937_c0_g1_i2:89-667(-)
MLNGRRGSVKNDDFSCILEASPGMGALYLGNMDASMDVTMLKLFNVKAVLTVATTGNTTYKPEIVPFHHIIPADDKDDYDLRTWFDRAFDFIEVYRRRGYSVLVHCFAGVSRSPTIVIAYLMSKHRWTYETSLLFVRSKRQKVYPNMGFTEQLRRYDQELKTEREKITPVLMRSTVISSYYPTQPATRKSTM